MTSTIKRLPFCSAGNGWFGLLLATHLIQSVYVDYRLKSTSKNIENKLETLENKLETLENTLKNIEIRLDQCKNQLK